MVFKFFVIFCYVITIFRLHCSVKLLILDMLTENHRMIFFAVIGQFFLVSIPHWMWWKWSNVRVDVTDSSYDFLFRHWSIFSSVHPSLDVVKIKKCIIRYHGRVSERVSKIIGGLKSLLQGLWNYVKEASKNFVCRNYRFNF